MSVEDVEKKFIVDQIVAATLYVSMLEESLRSISEEIPNDADSSPEFLTTLSAAGMLLTVGRKFKDVAAVSTRSLGLSDVVKSRLKPFIEKVAK